MSSKTTPTTQNGVLLAFASLALMRRRKSKQTHSLSA